MMGWGISDKAPENEKIKSEFNDFLQGMNSCAEISYVTYSAIYDKAMPLFDKIYELGKQQNTNKGGE